MIGGKQWSLASAFAARKAWTRGHRCSVDIGQPMSVLRNLAIVVDDVSAGEFGDRCRCPRRSLRSTGAVTIAR